VVVCGVVLFFLYLSEHTTHTTKSERKAEKRRVLCVVGLTRVFVCDLRLLIAARLSFWGCALMSAAPPRSEPSL